MNDLQKGDFITNEQGDVREMVEARLEDLIFTRVVYPNGDKGPVMGPTHIEDAEARGFRKETEAPQDVA